MQDQQHRIERQVHLPLSKAFEIALRNIRIRFGRSMITASGILLGIAFLATVITQIAAQDALNIEVTEELRMRNIWLVTLALLMSTIGITNSMLMSVTERFKEIGTMKCLGALDRFVVTMFILEGMLMGVIASVLGALVGAGVQLLAIGFGQGWSVLGKLDWGLLGGRLALCILLGGGLTFVATIAPAYRAAKMPPAAALRVEI